MFSLIQAIFLVVLDKDDMCLKRMIGLFAATTAGLLTHFYFWIWLGIFSFGYLLYLLFAVPLPKGKIKAVGLYIITMIASLGGATLLFPNWYQNIFLNKATKGNSSLMKIFRVDNLLSDFGTAISVTCRNLVADSGTTGALILFLLVTILYISKKKCNYKLVLTAISSIVYAVFVIHTQPTSEERYLWSSTILLFVVFVSMLMDIIYFLESKVLSTWKRSLGYCLAVLLATNAFFSIGKESESSSYLKIRSKQEKEMIQAENDCPWIVFYNGTDWVFLCSMYDFTIPQSVKRERTDAQGSYDEMIQDAEKIVIYTDVEQKSIEHCIVYIEDSCSKKVDGYEQIGKSYKMTVYRLHLK